MMTHLMKHYQDELAGGSKSKGREIAEASSTKVTLYKMKVWMPQEDTACFLQAS